MGLLDAVVSRHFGGEKAGRVVAFPADRPVRAYLVKSESDELEIRACLSRLARGLSVTGGTRLRRTAGIWVTMSL